MDNIIERSNDTLYNDSLYGGVEYSRVLNADTNLQVGDVSSASIKFKVKNNDFTIDEELTYRIKYENDTDSIYVGTFYVTDIVKNRSDYTITAYDAITTKFNKECTEWKNTLTLPMSLGDILISMCNYLGVQSGNTSFVNNAFTFNENVIDDGISFRQILGWIAQCAGGFAYIFHNRVFVRAWSDYSVKSYTSANYKTLEQADYICPPITKVWVGMDDSDVGTFYDASGSESPNTLKIYNNPFLYVSDVHPQYRPEDDTSSTQYISDALERIYNVISFIEYRPFKMTTFLDELFENGQEPRRHYIITINGEENIPFSISWNKSGVTIESTGDADRNTVEVQSLAEQKLNGSYNSMKRTVDETRSEIGNVQGQISTVSQTIDGVQITLQSNIDALEGELDDHAEKQLEYIRYGFGEGLVLGKEGDPISAQLTNSELAFKNGSVKNAYISKDELYISKARIVGNLGTGTGAQLFIGPWQFILRSDGSLDIKVG